MFDWQRDQDVVPVEKMFKKMAHMEIKTHGWAVLLLYTLHKVSSMIYFMNKCNNIEQIQFFEEKKSGFWKQRKSTLVCFFVPQN